MNHHDTKTKITIGSVALLSGHLRTPPLAELTDRAILSLPLNDNQNIFENWIKETSELTTIFGLPSINLKLFHSPNSLRNTQIRATNTCTRVNLSIHPEPLAYRGSGGLMKDIADDYDDDDFILFCSSSSILLKPLHVIVRDLLTSNADISFFNDPKGTPHFLTLVKAGCLKTLNPQGYLDFKEQALPHISKSYSIKSIDISSPAVFSIRTAADYIQALKLWHWKMGDQKGESRLNGFRPSFELRESSVEIDPTAEIIDSVVLKGSKIAANAKVIRSVVSKKNSVKPNEQLIYNVIQNKSFFTGSIK